MLLALCAGFVIQFVCGSQGWFLDGRHIVRERRRGKDNLKQDVSFPEIALKFFSKMARIPGTV